MILSNKPIIDWLFPKRCLVCFTDISHGDMCVSCREFCHRSPQRIDIHDHNSVFLFELTVKKIIKNAKFYKNYRHLLLMKKILNEALDDKFMAKIIEFSPEIVTFVPNHWLHRLLRGCELPSFFANIFASKLKIPVVPLLKKNKFLNRQALQKSKKERKIAIKGAFSLKKNSSFSRILLIDDIVTTGETFNEIKKVLGSNKEILCVAVAKTL